MYNQHLRCQSKNAHGIQCGFPKGHKGSHGNGLQHRTWTDPKYDRDTVKKLEKELEINAQSHNKFTAVDLSGRLDQIHTSGYVQEIKKK